MGCNCKSKRAGRSSRPASRSASRRRGKLNSMKKSDFERKPTNHAAERRKARRLRKTRLSKDE